MVYGRPGSRQKGKKSVPPSRVRYEQAHPTVTVRISSELRERLDFFKEAHGLSLGDVLRIGLEKAEPDLDRAYGRGANDGYEEAKEEYEVTYRCRECRQRHLNITSDEEKKAAADLMYQAGWHSPDCL